MSQVKQSTKILLVDDDPDILELLEYNLAKENYVLAKAVNGQQALEIAKTFKPNVASAKVTASKQLNVTGTEYTVFNIKIAHPVTGSIYPFGEQRLPLYIDESTVKTAEAGVPLLTLSAKLITI